MSIYYHHIYKITNKINGKCYIGKTQKFKKRFDDHRNSCSTYIGNAIRKYGEENFSFEMIEVIPFFWKPTRIDIKKYVNSREIFWISYYNSYGGGYNLTPGGDGIDSDLASKIFKKSNKKRIENNTHNFQSDEFKEFQSKRMSNLSEMGVHPWQTKEHRMRASNHMTEYNNTPEIKEKNIKRMKENNPGSTPEGRLKTTIMNKNRTKREIYIKVKNLFIELKIKQPKGMPWRTDIWLEEKLKELIKLKEELNKASFSSLFL